MSGLVLTLKEPPRQRFDLSPLLPERLQGLDAAAISALELAGGNRRAHVGDFFAVTPGDPSDLRIAGSSDRLDHIGHGMTGGAITVAGDAGAYLGLAMTGGRLVVEGNAGPYAAAMLGGGTIEIGGNAGDHLGGAPAGEMKGMGGGLVVVRGNAGERAGDRMRRGTIIVEGSVGACAAARMIAGTLVVLGPELGPYPGFGMKRGTLLHLVRPQRELPSFADCGRHDLGFLGLLLRDLRGHSRRLDSLATRPTSVHRFVGDLANGGMGELLFWPN